jgi:hypothetical protein
MLSLYYLCCTGEREAGTSLILQTVDHWDSDLKVPCSNLTDCKEEILFAKTYFTNISVS